MKNLCILGNSHVACLIKGWKLLKSEYEDKKVTFFAMPGFGLDRLQMDGDRLVADNQRLKEFLTQTSGGLDYIDINSYDLYLVYGLGLVIYQNEGYYYSQDIIKASLKDHVLSSKAWHLFKKIREITDKPVYIGHRPLLAASSSSEGQENMDSYLYRIQCLNDMFKQANVIFLEQPQETIKNGFETNEEYNKGASGLLGNEDVSDDFHMNEKFGVVYLRHFLNVI